jgi:hypothetical protein
MWMTNQHEDPPAGAGGSADAAAAAAAAAGQGGAGGDTSLLQQGAGANDQDWIPEKYRTLKEGTQDLDFEASARKLGEGYKALEAKLGSGATGTVPASAADYKLELPKDAEGKPLVEGVDLEAFVADPLFKDLATKAHAAGITNEQMQFFVGEYLQFIPGVLEANGKITVDEARAELGKVWKSDQEVDAGLAAAARAAKGFAAEGDAPGSFGRLMAKFGNDPDFLAFAAKVGSEMQEDRPIGGDPIAVGDWDAQVAAIRTDPAYTDGKHPQHRQKVQELEALYQKRYGTGARRAGGAAVR